MKVSSYQKLKREIEVLQAESRQLKTDIHAILKTKDPLTIIKWKMIIQMEDNLWFGSVKSSNNGVKIIHGQ